MLFTGHQCPSANICSLLSFRRPSHLDNQVDNLPSCTATRPARTKPRGHEEWTSLVGQNLFSPERISRSTGLTTPHACSVQCTRVASRPPPPRTPVQISDSHRSLNEPADEFCFSSPCTHEKYTNTLASTPTHKTPLLQTKRNLAFNKKRRPDSGQGTELHPFAECAQTPFEQTSLVRTHINSCKNAFTIPQVLNLFSLGRTIRALPVRRLFPVRCAHRVIDTIVPFCSSYTDNELVLSAPHLAPPRVTSCSAR